MLEISNKWDYSVGPLFLVFTFSFEIIVDSQGVAEIVQRGGEHPSPSGNILYKDRTVSKPGN